MSFNFNLTRSFRTDEIEMAPTALLSKKHFENIPWQQATLSKQDEKARNRFMQYRNTLSIAASTSPVPRAKSPLPEGFIVSQKQFSESVVIKPVPEANTRPSFQPQKISLSPAPSSLSPSPFLLEEISISPSPVSQSPSPLFLDKHRIGLFLPSRPVSPFQLDMPCDSL